MTNRWYSADDKSSLLSHKIGIRFPKRFPDQSFDPLFIHPICPTGDDQDWAVCAFGLKNQRFDDLTYFTAYCFSRF